MESNWKFSYKNQSNWKFTVKMQSNWKLAVKMQSNWKFADRMQFKCAVDTTAIELQTNHAVRLQSACSTHDCMPTAIGACGLFLIRGPFTYHPGVSPDTQDSELLLTISIFKNDNNNLESHPSPRPTQSVK